MSTDRPMALVLAEAWERVSRYGQSTGPGKRAGTSALIRLSDLQQWNAVQNGNVPLSDAPSIMERVTTDSILAR